jgi:transposase InsO family protein
MKFAFIAAHRETYQVGRLCAVLAVSRSGYYAWVERPRSARAQADDGLQVRIGVIHRTNRGCYGAPRVHAELQQQGQRCGRKRVARVMRQSGLRGCTPRRRRVVTTDSRHGYPIAPNHLAQDFTAAAPNRVWVADITYIATGEGWLYLAAVMDLYARGVVGWAMAATMTQQLSLEALQMALSHRQPPPGWVHHSDRGSQYAATDYQRLLAAHGARVSMSRTGNCYDNAAMESFFHTLKTELVYREHYATREQARRSVFDYIEVFYNRQRRHSTLGYATPAEFEKQNKVA